MFGDCYDCVEMTKEEKQQQKALKITKSIDKLNTMARDLAFIKDRLTVKEEINERVINDAFTVIDAMTEEDITNGYDTLIDKIDACRTYKVYKRNKSEVKDDVEKYCSTRNNQLLEKNIKAKIRVLKSLLGYLRCTDTSQCRYDPQIYPDDHYYD